MEEITRTPEEEKQIKKERQRAYESKNYRLNLVFPKGTKERIEALGLNKTNSAFIRDTVISKIEELEEVLKIENTHKN